MTDPAAPTPANAPSPPAASTPAPGDEGPSAARASHDGHAPAGSRVALVVGAIGIVFGDIGTSPLYAMQECMHGPHGVAPTPANVLGVLSLVFWSLTMVVTVKYLAFVMRADNRGEGGILALLALVPERLRATPRGQIGWVSVLVIAGAALLFGDGIITPSISVLSAMEGLRVATTSLSRAVVPLTCAILVGLFAVQSRGTAAIGRFFGPIMVAWFLTLAGLGVYHLAKEPHVLAALSPHHGARFFAHHGWHGFRLLGSVVLCVTGGEALYADMGHFGRKPIRLAWLALVFPSLVLCYFGQGALLLRHPEFADQPFFSMVPRGPATYALVAIAAPATVIASQALISGVFSLTHQAIRLGFFPRVAVKHTSGEAEGQIYVPAINWGLAVSCVLLVLIFQRSSRLAAAYGLAVTGTMVITSIVFFAVTQKTWNWKPGAAVAVLALFLAFDLPYFFANLLKFFDGGYLPIVVGAGFFVAMVLWRRGRTLLAEHYARRTEKLEDFIARLAGARDGGAFRASAAPAGDGALRRSPGAAVIMASSAAGVPPVLAHFVKRVQVVPETVALLTITTEHTPTADEAERVSVERLGEGFFRVVARYGFMETPDVVSVLARARAEHGLPIDPRRATFFIGRETFIGGVGGRMGRVSEGLFSFLSRNALSATAYFGVPHEQVIEVGTQIDL